MFSNFETCPVADAPCKCNIASAPLPIWNPMENKRTICWVINCLIAAVWLVNGLFCKVLNLVPRHREIVGRILETSHAALLTTLIGLLEIIMAIWIVSRVQSKLNAVVQMLLVATMNTLEFILVPDMLLWGKLNSLFAFIFILVIYCNEFIWGRKTVQTM